MEDGQKFIDPFLVRRQDSEASEESWSFFAVYDGHGGKVGMEYCRDRLHANVLAEIQNSTSSSDTCRALESAFRKTDSQLAMVGAWSNGCTATVALLQRLPGAEVRLHMAHVGDSRAVLLGAGGVLRLCRDHRADDPAEVRRIVEEGGSVTNNRVSGILSVSRSLGDHHLKHKGVSCVPDTSTHDVACGHVLVIASDGLWDALSDEDALVVVQGCIDRATKQGGGGQQALSESLRECAAQALVSRALELGSRDNILAMVVFF
jgi:serine/threonine protein phosphatase PrpC